MFSRQRLYEILNIAQKGDKVSAAYDVFMIILVIGSLSSLVFVDDTLLVLEIIDAVAVSVFIIDYILRWITADIHLGKGWKSFIMYPFTLMAIFDLLSIVPGVIMVGNGLQILRTVRFLRLFRAFRLIRHSRGVLELFAALKRVKMPLLSVVLFVLTYILLVALVMFSIEPATFENDFLNALYWSTISITTVGYGDFSPVSAFGKVINMISSLVAVIVIALPVSIVTAGYMIEITNFFGKDIVEGSGGDGGESAGNETKTGEEK